MNELYHVHGFKYVKREWKNGKWNYYYDNGKGKSTSLGIVNKISDWIGEDEKENARRANTRAANASKAATTAHNRRASSINNYKQASGEYAYREKAHDRAAQKLSQSQSRLRIDEDMYNLAKKNPWAYLQTLSTNIFDSTKYITNAAEYGFASYIAKQNPDSVAYSTKPRPIDELMDMSNWPKSDRQAYEVALRGTIEDRMNTAKAFCSSFGYERVTGRRLSEANSRKLESTNKASDAIRSDINAQANAREAQRAADNANALYESTFLGKAEKGMNWIKNLFK